VDEVLAVDAFRELVRSRIGDPDRLHAVTASGLVASTPEPAFDRLAELAATVLRTPWAFVTVVDAEHSFWKACTGVGDLTPQERRNRVEESFCQYVIGTEDVFVVDDARRDPRTADNVSVAAMGVVAWAGAPIRSPEGEVLGTVCVVDSTERRWAETDTEILVALAALAADEIRLRTLSAESERSARHLAELAVQASRSQAVLSTVLERAPIGFALFGPDLRFKVVNEALAAINGVRAADHLGRSLHEVVPSMADHTTQLLRHVLDTGSPVIDAEHRGETPAVPGLERVWTVSYYRIETPDEVVGVAALVTEVTESRRAEQRMRQVLDGVSSFVGLLDPEGGIVEVNQTALAAAGLTEAPPRGVPVWDTFWWSHSDDARRDLRLAVQRATGGETVRYDTDVRVLGDRRITVDVQLVPRLEHGRVTGVVISGLDITERFEARRRTEQMAQLARSLTCAATTAAALDVIRREGAAVLGACAADVVLFDRSLLPAADGAAVDLPLDPDSVVCEAADSGSVVVRTVPPGSAAARTDGVPARVVAAAPLLRTDGTTFGALSATWTDGVPAPAAISAVAELCAQTLVRTNHADASHHLVDTLQRELLAPTEPNDHLEVAVRYQPAARELRFGGDWYEVVPLDHARTAVIVGDVAGHGVSAAARMAQVRTVMSTLVQLGGDLTGIFDQAERLIERNLRPLFATVAVSVIDTTAGTVSVLSAGHPPPLVVDPDGTVRVAATAHRPLLGVGGARLDPSPIPFPPGSVLVSYTDGLVERRGESIDAGLDRLARHLALVAAEPVETLADEILARLLDAGHDDDAALAVVRRRPA
jgi:PAS domain S-box-containing protein